MPRGINGATAPRTLVRHSPMQPRSKREEAIVSRPLFMRMEKILKSIEAILAQENIRRALLDVTRDRYQSIVSKDRYDVLISKNYGPKERNGVIRREVVYTDVQQKVIESRCISGDFSESSELMDKLASIAGNRLVVVIDLDETLVHAGYRPDSPVDMYGNKIHMDLFVRPGAIELLNLLALFDDIEVVVWSAGDRLHVANVLEIIDPQRRIQIAICRDDDYERTKQVNWVLNPEYWWGEKDPLFHDSKPLSILPDEISSKAILIDNSVLATRHTPQSIVVPDFLAGHGLTVEEYYDPSSYERYKEDPTMFMVFSSIMNIYSRINEVECDVQTALDYLHAEQLISTVVYKIDEATQFICRGFCEKLIAIHSVVLNDLFKNTPQLIQTRPTP